MRHQERAVALDRLEETATEILEELREATRSLLESAAYHRAAADELRDEARRQTSSSEEYRRK